MKVGAYFPLREVGPNFDEVGGYLRTLEELGCDHVRLGEHVVGVDAGSRDRWTGIYDHSNSWHEPFVMLGWMSSLVDRLAFATATLTLPQRQTVLVAKQAAQADLLLGGRLRLGVGVGWNAAEFEALGADFANRGARIEEQIDVLRMLWMNPVVDFSGRWHRLNNVGINPLPVQRPIPIWIGGGPGSPRPAGAPAPPNWERALHRAARLADGWFPGPYFLPDEEGQAWVERLRDWTAAAGRPRDAVDIQANIRVVAHPHVEQWHKLAVAWRRLGATHISLDTIGAGLDTFDRHLDAVRRFVEVLRDVDSGADGHSAQAAAASDHIASRQRNGDRR